MLVAGTHTQEKKVCITYIYVGMFLLQGLFTFPDEHDKTVY